MPIAKRPPPEFFKFATNVWTQPFWDATARHRLIAPRCGQCGLFRMPPTPFCPACQSQSLDWQTLSGQGIVYSYTIVERSPVPGFQAFLPYVPAVIELAEAPGIRLVSNVVDIETGLIAVGLRVSVIWDDQPEGVALPRFIPAKL